MNKRVHYAWIVCASCAMMMFLSYGVMANVFSVYVPTIVEANGFTYAQGTNLSSIRSLTSLICSVLVNSLVKRFGPRKLCAISVITMVISRLLFALGGPYFVYVIASAISGFSFVLGGVVPVSVAIGNWFLAKRTLALGLTSAGTGLANFFLSPLVTSSLQKYGLSVTFLWEGGLMLIVGIAIFVLLRNAPKDKGMEQYTDESVGASTETLAGDEPSVSNFRWYLVLVACFLFAAPANAAFFNLPVLLDTFGYDKTVVGWLISYFGITMIIGKILMGRVYDKIGAFKANFIVCICSSGAMLIFSTCLGTGSVIFPALAITILGVGQILSTITQPVWARDLRGNNGFSKGISQLTFSFMLGSLVHNSLVSLIIDKTGSYVPAYFMCFAFTVIGMVILQGVYLSRGK